MKPITALAVGRIAAGASAFLLPSLSGQLLGVGGPPQAHLAARLFGGRDLVLGIATLTFKGERRAGIITAGAAADVLDIASAALGARQGTLHPAKALPLIAVAAGATVIGVGELRG